MVKLSKYICFVFLFLLTVFVQDCCSPLIGEDEACGLGNINFLKAFDEPIGYIYSPGYEEGKDYPNSIGCYYQIKTYEKWNIRLTFEDFDLEESRYCLTDSLLIYGTDERGRFAHWLTYCGKQTPRDFQSSGNAVDLEFRTDDFGTAKGFKIKYSAFPAKDFCPRGEKKCRNRNCVSQSLFCDGKDDCGDGTDEENCNRPLVVTQCGIQQVKSTFFRRKRIVGGEISAPGSWPWMADLQHIKVWPSAHRCGGALINAQWVLSAAHCFQSSPSREATFWRIHLGNRNTFKQDIGEQIRYVERIVIYDDIPKEEFEKIGRYSLKHDIALIKLSAPVQFSDYVQPACLPGPDFELSVGEKCYLSGWGLTHGSGGAGVLKEAIHPIQHNETCLEIFPTLFVSDFMICAGNLEAGHGACTGDSGGPLVCKVDDRWTLMGVTNFIPKGSITNVICGMRNRPTAFHKVSKKIDWIYRMIDKYS